MSGKKPYHNENLKEKILEVTIILVKKDGYQYVSTRKIARELGISSTAIYRHYHNLEDLFLQVIVRLSNTLANKLKHNVNENESATSCLEVIGVNFVRFSIENFYVFDLLFLSPYSPKEIFESGKDLKEFSTIALFLQLIERVIHENKITSEPQMLFVQLWSFILGYSVLIRENNILFNQTVIQETIQRFISSEETS